MPVFNYCNTYKPIKSVNFVQLTQGLPEVLEDPESNDLWKLSQCSRAKGTLGRVNPYRNVKRQVKVLIRNWAIFFLCPSKQFLPISFQIQLLEYFSQKRMNKGISSQGILISWLPHKFRSLNILGPLSNFKIQQWLSWYSSDTHRDWIQSSRNVQLGPGKQRGKTWFGLEK